MLYAPLVKAETIQALCRIGPAVNVLAAGKATSLTAGQIGDLGAARISVGGTLARLTHALILEAGRKVLEGDLTPLGAAASAGQIDAILKG